MKLLSVILFLLITLLNNVSKKENNFVKKEGYYFTYQMSCRLGKSEIWILNFYKGFIEQKSWNNNEKINICGFPIEEPSSFILVREENQYTVEENYIERLLLGQDTKLDSLIKLFNESTKIFYQSKNRKIKLKIIYGSFKFKHIRSTVEKYEDQIYSSPHKRTRIDLSPKTKINFLDIVDYDNIKLLSSQELEKLRVKKRPCR